MKSKDLYNNISLELQKVYDMEEAQSMAVILLEEYFEIDRGVLLANSEIKTDSIRNNKLQQAIQRIKNHEPIQHVLGKAHFYGRDFMVTTDVLIPRRETEELVHLICKNHPDFNGKILDIGTGSGCIPIVLSLELPQAKVESLDISKAALSIARQNAEELKAKVNFVELDILNDSLSENTYNIVVSNPPYVMQSEKQSMSINVLDYEPHHALFVEDADPLIYYNAIINKTKYALNSGGKLYFEINEKFGQQVAEAMKNADFIDVEVIQDMQGKDRIVSGLTSNPLEKQTIRV